MKSVTPPTPHTPRRNFVTRLLAGAAALPLFASFASAQPGNGQRQPGQGRQGLQGLGLQGLGRQGQGRPPGGRPDPAQMATRLITEFDRDGDGALNPAELAAALVALHERRPGGRGQRRGGQRQQGNRQQQPIQ